MKDNIKEKDARVCTAFICLRIGRIDSMLWTRKWNVGLYERLAISWIAEPLSACQEELCSVELVKDEGPPVPN
jgi:hypothetical protein